MPRIRTIKPEFWSDEKLSHLSSVDRLVFLGLIGMADDFGRLHDNIKVIDAFVFPNTDETVRESVANLLRIGRIIRGKSSNGTPIIEIANWSRHQRVDKPQTATALPPICHENEKNTGKTDLDQSFENYSRTIPEPLATGSGIRDQGSGIRDQGEGSVANSLEKSPLLENKSFRGLWERWKGHRLSKGKRLDQIEAEAQLCDLARYGVDEATAMVEYSIRQGAKNLITNGDHRGRPPNSGGGRDNSKTRAERVLEALK